MLCDKCQKETASVHVTKIVNGKKTEMHLCQACAQELGEFNLNIDLPNFFASLFDHSKFAQKITQPKACPVCRLTLEDFRQINQFGCSECYTTFRSEIEPLLRRLHGSSSHEGKIPARSYADLSVERQIKLLREKLQQMISVENYEEAARIRDQIRALEHQS
ncbi:MAG: UvrB/UvrC motif-containing protein [Candidatus Wallacebacter cryptica]|jgi:protein arginine kinase activator|nr:hypothetical protein [Bacillota bacterium]